MAIRHICLLAFVATAAATRLKILGVNSDPCIDTFQIGGAGVAQVACTGAEVPPSASTIYLPANRGGAVRAVVSIGSNSQYSLLNVEMELSLATAGAASCAAANIDNAAGTVTTLNRAFDIPAAWTTSAMQIETAPRRLCIRPVGGVLSYSGFHVAAVFECSVNTDCTSRTPIANDVSLAGTANLATLSAEVAARTVCCAGAAPVTDGTTPATGICIDERTTKCCGGRGHFRGSEQCCQESSQTIRGENQMCPCVRDGTGGSIGCPASTTCCLASKYGTTDNLMQEGRCFNATTHRCCDTGSVYDPAASQCCVVSGVQDIATPCPCAADSDCVGGQAALFPATALTTGRCCKSFNPSIREETRCSKWTNFPSPSDASGRRVILDNDGVAGSGIDLITPGQLQNPNQQLAQGRCPGRCVDTEYQTCCNGEICHQEYEKCCNSTCCNKFTSHCAEGLRMGSPGHLRNPTNLHARFSVCSTVQNLGPIRAFLVYALPTFLLAATLLALALVLTLCHTVTSRAYSFVEIALMILATFAILFSIPSFFSPAYKYGVFVILAALLAILSATSRTLWLNALALAAVGVVVLYAFNPFSGSVLYDLGSKRGADGVSDAYGDGLIRSVAGGWSMDETNNMNMQRCSMWYTGYFMNDLNIRDWRVENPEDNYFGYCSRAWIATLAILQAVTLALLVGLFALTLLAMVLRFRKVSFDAVPGF